MVTYLTYQLISLHIQLAKGYSFRPAMGAPGVLIAPTVQRSFLKTCKHSHLKIQETLRMLYFLKFVYKVTAKQLLFLSSVTGAAPQIAVAAMQFTLLFSRQGKLELQRWCVPLSKRRKRSQENVFKPF